MRRETPRQAWRGVLRRAGLIGALMFLIKGLVWLAAAGAVALGLL